MTEDIGDEEYTDEITQEEINSLVNRATVAETKSSELKQAISTIQAGSTDQCPSSAEARLCHTRPQQPVRFVIFSTRYGFPAR